MPGSMTRIDIELMKMIEPPPCCFIGAMTCCVSCSAPKPLPETMATRSRSSISIGSEMRCHLAAEGGDLFQELGAGAAAKPYPEMLDSGRDSLTQRRGDLFAAPGEHLQTVSKCGCADIQP